MRISIVIAVLNSPEVVRRQVLHFRRMPMPEDVELIIVDDKSSPPLRQEDYDLPRLRILRYEECRGAWTQPAARNFGARHAVGQYLICTDIDHIIAMPLLLAVREGRYHFIKFRREVAVLDKDGRLVQTPETVLEYGFERWRFDRGGYHIPPHTNSFAIDRNLYLQLGGVSERRVGTGRHPNREEIPLRRKLGALWTKGEIRVLDEGLPGDDSRPMIYMIPNGRYCGHKDYNPFGLFHSLPRKTQVQ